MQAGDEGGGPLQFSSDRQHPHHPDFTPRVSTEYRYFTKHITNSADLEFGCRSSILLAYPKNNALEHFRRRRNDME
jgi:hypothetical protein